MKKTSTERSKADSWVFRKMVDEEVRFTVCVHVDDLLIVVTVKDKKTFDGLYFMFN